MKMGIVFILLFPLIIYSQQMTVKGKIYDSNTRNVLIGASINIVGTSKTVSTDKNGEYVIRNIRRGKHDLLCTYVGYKKEVKTIILKNPLSIVDFYLKEDSTKKGIVIPATKEKYKVIPLKK